MLAVSYLQCLLAASVFFGTIGLAVAIIVWGACLWDDEIVPRWIVLPGAIVAMTVLVATFVWLGSGPLNG